jgi:hypothetical protein
MKPKTKNTHNYALSEQSCAPCSKGSKVKKNGKELSNKKSITCYSRPALVKIAQSWNSINKGGPQILVKEQSKGNIWKQIQQRLAKTCENDETCWKKQEFVKRLKDTEIQLYTFKPDYPEDWIKNKYTWLNTYDILYVMKQYEMLHKDFMFLGPIPSDCPTKIRCELSNLNLALLKRNGIRKVGIIYNLDVSSGPGTHWVAVYIDLPHNEINYYDSYGSMPIKLIKRFLVQLGEKMKDGANIIYNNKRHQYGNSECGVYSMNFILERLHGSTMYDISNVAIPDSEMNHLRSLLYNKTRK